jgi:sugar phosphate isomerase/epimerase
MAYGPIVSAPSMVFGMDLVENVESLSQFLEHVEIVIFHTPECHNIPTDRQTTRLKEIKSNKHLSFSVHLPPSFEIASPDETKKNAAVALASKIVHLCEDIKPEFYILHVPVTAPTLTAEPGKYLKKNDRPEFNGWLDRAAAGLEKIQAETQLGLRLLVENINYSPKFLKPFWQRGLCGFCLDIGHLLLGNEAVLENLDSHLPAINDIHLHGVVDQREHLALDVLPEERVKSWIDKLITANYRGIVNLEVFSPEDLEISLAVIRRNGFTQAGMRKRETDQG